MRAHSSIPYNRPPCLFFQKNISNPNSLIRTPRLLIFHFFWEKPEKESRCYVRKVLTEMCKQCFNFLQWQFDSQCIDDFVKKEKSILFCCETLLQFFYSTYESFSQFNPFRSSTQKCNPLLNFFCSVSLILLTPNRLLRLPPPFFQDWITKIKKNRRL